MRDRRNVFGDRTFVKVELNPWASLVVEQVSADVVPGILPASLRACIVAAARVFPQQGTVAVLAPNDDRLAPQFCLVWREKSLLVL